MRLGVLVSGSGSNLQAILDAVAAGTLGCEVAVVVSNRPGVAALDRARRAGVATEVLATRPFRGADGWRAAYDAALADLLAPYAVDLVVLAGWMHILGPAFLDRYPQRVMNLHPALPGELPGMHAIDRAFEAAQRGERHRTGVMVHWVVPAVDAGPVIAQREVPIHPDDTLADLEARVHATEHALLVEAIRRQL